MTNENLLFLRNSPPVSAITSTEKKNSMILDAPVKKKSTRRVFVIDGPLPLNEERIYDYCKSNIRRSSSTSSTSAEKLIGVAHGVKVRSLKRKYKSQERSIERSNVREQNTSQEINEEDDQIARANILLSALDEYTQDHITSSLKPISSKSSEGTTGIPLLNIDRNVKGNTNRDPRHEDFNQEKKRCGNSSTSRNRERRHYTDMELNFEDYTPSPAAERALVKGIGLAREKGRNRQVDIPKQSEVIEIRSSSVSNEHSEEIEHDLINPNKDEGQKRSTQVEEDFDEYSFYSCRNDYDVDEMEDEEIDDENDVVLIEPINLMSKFNAVSSEKAKK